MNYLRLITLPCITLASASAFAISNIENVRPGMPDEGWTGHIELGLDGKAGNQSEKNYSLSSKIVWRQTQNILLAIAERNYGSSGGTKDTDDSFIHGRWIHLLNPSWATEAFTQWEEDSFDNLVSRTLLGGGVRYVVLDQPKIISLSLGLGGFREREKLDLGTFQETDNNWRMNTYYSYSHQLNEQVVLNSTSYYQPNTDDFSDYRILFTAGLSVKITDALRLGLNYKLTHDSDPVQNLNADPVIDNKKTNTEYSTALSYQF